MAGDHLLVGTRRRCNPNPKRRKVFGFERSGDEMEQAKRETVVRVGKDAEERKRDVGSD